MFGISGFELLIIAVFVLVIFGPDKLPELARQFGKAMATLKKAQEDMERIVRAEMITGQSVSTAPVQSTDSEDAAPVSKASATASASAVWSATEDDDEEEDEE